jgi:excisionase family DNA binding protein
LLTVAEAADRMQISRFTLYRMIQNGHLPATRTRGRTSLLIDPDDLDIAFAPVPARIPVKPYYAPHEVADILGCHVDTVRHLVNTGTLKATRAPGRSSRMRIDIESVNAYATAGHPGQQ